MYTIFSGNNVAIQILNFQTFQIVTQQHLMITFQSVNIFHHRMQDQILQPAF